MRHSTYPLVQFSQLIDCPVWDGHTGQLLGTVYQVWLDKQLHQVLGLTYRSLLDSSEQRSLTWEQVLAVSPEGAWLNISDNTALIIQPKASIHYQLGGKVWTNTDTQIGTLIDYYFHGDTGEILLYQCVPSDTKGYYPQLMDLYAGDLSFRGDRWQIELTDDSQSPLTTEGMVSSPAKSNIRNSLNDFYLDPNLDAYQFSYTDSSLGHEISNLIAI